MIELGPATNGFWPVDPEAERALEAWAFGGRFPSSAPRSRSEGMEVCPPSAPGCPTETEDKGSHGS